MLARHCGDVDTSVGIALHHPGDGADDILRKADLAMHAAKTTVKSRYALATPDRHPPP